MLRVTVELVPYGDESKKKQIGQMVIANDSSGDSSKASYQAWTAADAWSKEPARFGKLSGYDRSQSVWELVRLVLEAVRLEKHIPDNDLSERLKGKLL